MVTELPLALTRISLGTPLATLGSAMQIWPGQPFPLGATYDGNGTNFSLFSEVATRVELCLFDDDGKETRVTLPEVTALCWHGYLPGIKAGPALRVPRAWTLGAGAGALVQSQQAAARSIREGDRRRVDVERGDVPVSLRQARRLEERSGQRPLHAEVRRGRRQLRLGGRQAPAHAVAHDDRLRNARQGVHEASSGPARASARHLRRPRASRRRSSTCRSWASPPSSCCRSTSSCRTRCCSSAACATTGATTRSATSRRTTNTACVRARAASRCRNSRAPSRRCTGPASK